MFTSLLYNDFSKTSGPLKNELQHCTIVASLELLLRKPDRPEREGSIYDKAGAQLGFPENLIRIKIDKHRKKKAKKGGGAETFLSES